MTKFEEEFDKNVHVTSEMLTGRKICSANQAKALGHGWVSPEDHQARVDELIEAKEKNIELLRKNSTLKSQLQQQALPVVPSLVADWYEFHMNGTFSAVVTAYAFAGDDKAVIWLGENGGMDLLCKMKLYGYTVEKPQLFYLKHIDMSKCSRYFDFYLEYDGNESMEHKRVDKGEKPGTGYEKSYYTFTQQEIDSMQTGSYEQIEVTE